MNSEANNITKNVVINSIFHILVVQTNRLYGSMRWKNDIGCKQERFILMNVIIRAVALELKFEKEKKTQKRKKKKRKIHGRKFSKGCFQFAALSPTWKTATIQKYLHVAQIRIVFIKFNK